MNIIFLHCGELKADKPAPIILGLGGWGSFGGLGGEDIIERAKQEKSEGRGKKKKLEQDYREAVELGLWMNAEEIRERERCEGALEVVRKHHP